MKQSSQRETVFGWIASTLGAVAISIAIGSLLILLANVFSLGISRLDWGFLTRFPSRFPDSAGIKSALVGTFWVVGLTGLIAIPIGVLSAVYLEEFAHRNAFTKLIRLNIENLAGVPSILYGILGLGVFVRGMEWGRSILSAAMTLSLLILPTIIITACEALKAVPKSMRLAAYGLGATRTQVVFSHVVPSALPGIVTGVLLGLSRAMGESAPLIMIGGLTFVAFLPESMMDGFTVLSIQIFNWAGRPQAEFQEVAAAGILVLLSIVLFFNFMAYWIRSHSQRKQGA